MAMDFEWSGDAVAGGAWFRELRESREKTLQEVADATGLTQQSLSRLEMGKVAKPSLGALVQLGNYFGVTPNQIVKAFGLPVLTLTQEENIPGEVRYVLEVLGRLGPGDRLILLKQIEAITRMADR